MRRRDQAEETAYQRLTGSATAERIVIDLTVPDVGCSSADRTSFTTIKSEQLSSDRISEDFCVRAADLLMPPNKSSARVQEIPATLF